jgi:hypothetical protein
MPNGDRFLVLDRGRRYEGTAGTAEYRVMEFDRYALRIETKEARGFEESPRTKALWDLLRDPQPAHLAELLWRLGLPLAALNLAVLAIPLSFVNPRAGRTNNLIFALLTYMIYSNLLSVSQAWVAQGKLAFRDRGMGGSSRHVRAAHRAFLSTAESPRLGSVSNGAENLRAAPGEGDLCIHGLGADCIPDAFRFLRPDPRVGEHRQGRLPAAACLGLRDADFARPAV